MKIMFYYYFERKHDKVLKFNIVHLPPSNLRRTSRFQNLISAGRDIRGIL